MSGLKTFAVRKIEQVDNHTFTIEWNDGRRVSYRLSALQNCAHAPTAQTK